MRLTAFRPVTIAACLLLLTGVAGCGGTGDATSTPSRTTPSPGGNRTITVPTPDPPPPGVHLSFIQQRIDEGTHRSQVRVVNGTLHNVHVRSVGVDWAGFPLRLNRVDYDVPGQQIVDLRYYLTRADCSAAAGAAPMYGVAVLRSRTIREPMAADGKRFLSRIWKTVCTARRIARAVTVSYGDTWTVEGSGPHSLLHGELLLTRGAGDEPVTVAQVEGSVLFDLKTTGGTTLPSGAISSTVPITVGTGGRCDPHSLGQSTQTFLFRAFFRLGDSEPVGRLVVPTRRQQNRLLAFLDAACGSGG